MEHRRLLHRIDYEKGTITIKNKEYPLLDTNFPTIDPEHPYELTAEEAEVMERLRIAFLKCDQAAVSYEASAEPGKLI